MNLIEDLPSSGEKYIIVVAQKDGNVESPLDDDLYKTGTLATVMKIFDMPDNSKSTIVKGIRRVEINSITSNTPYFKSTIKKVNHIINQQKAKAFSVLRSLP